MNKKLAKDVERHILESMMKDEKALKGITERWTPVKLLMHN